MMVRRVGRSDFRESDDNSVSNLLSTHLPQLFHGELIGFADCVLHYLSRFGFSIGDLFPLRFVSRTRVLLMCVYLILRNQATMASSSSSQLPELPAEIVRDIVMSKDWATIMGSVKYQGQTCWALTTAELVSAVLFLKGKYTEYSAQELVDRADRSRIGRRSKEYHFCYTYSIRAERIPQRVTSGLAHIDCVDQLSLSQSLDRLQHQPVGASLLIFMPDYLLTGKGVYRGPMTNRSSYTAVHGVSVVAVVEEDGEKVCKVRLNHGLAIGDREAYLKVSMEMLVRVPTERGESDGKFDKPGMLLRDFMCPTVL
ncbi:hypothetical protein F2Q70_00034345 [Brassica cretica]|uniref:Peptidase C1A papain C-terminal domain-containing protein n=1 Tax=Brassica cretica TaxID=69181 RepID=A0A8S9JQX2_BRACR|nr:hypothetical protein F2Q70_00034345 [Brassica cretica]